MILEAVRVVADVLGDPTTGVAARLALLTYDGADTAPTAPAVIDETRHDDAAITRDTSTPLLVVTAGEVRSLIGQAAQYIHEADVPIDISLVRTATSPAAVVRDLYYTLRAVLVCLDNGLAASVLRNNVQVYVISDISAAQARASLEHNTATAAVRCTVRCRDLIA
jgi:hypothetical protein